MYVLDPDIPHMLLHKSFNLFNMRHKFMYISRKDGLDISNLPENIHWRYKKTMVESKLVEALRKGV